MALSRDEKNAKVYQAWANGQAANGSRNPKSDYYEYDSTYQTSTDGVTLWSYAMPIGSTNADGEKILLVPSYQVVSATTDKHIRDAWQYSDKQVYGLDNGVLDHQDRVEARPNMAMRFPSADEVGAVFTLRCERKTWKTAQGAKAAMQKLYPDSLIHDVLPVYAIEKTANRYGATTTVTDDTVWTIGFLHSYSASDVPASYPESL